MKKIFGTIVFILCMVFVLVALFNFNSSKNGNYNNNFVQNKITTDLTIDSEFVYGFNSEKYLQLSIPLYTDFECTEKATILTKYEPDTLEIQLNYFITEEENAVFSVEMQRENEVFHYDLPNGLSQYSYFKMDGTTFRLDWGKHLELAYYMTLHFASEILNASSGNLIITEKTSFGMPISSDYFPSFDYLLNPYKNFLHYYDNSNLTWLPVGDNLNLITSIWGGVSKVYFKVDFEVKDLTLDNGSSGDTGAGGGLGGGGTGSW